MHISSRTHRRRFVVCLRHCQFVPDNLTCCCRRRTQTAAQEHSCRRSGLPCWRFRPHRHWRAFLCHSSSFGSSNRQRRPQAAAPAPGACASAYWRRLRGSPHSTVLPPRRRRHLQQQLSAGNFGSQQCGQRPTACPSRCCNCCGFRQRHQALQQRRRPRQLRRHPLHQDSQQQRQPLQQWRHSPLQRRPSSGSGRETMETRMLTRGRTSWREMPPTGSGQFPCWQTGPQRLRQLSAMTQPP